MKPRPPHRGRRCGRLPRAGLSLIALAISGRAPAQSGAPLNVGARDTSDTTATVRRASAPWFTRRDAFMFGGALGATALLVPLDRPISGEFGEPDWTRSRRAHHWARDVAFFGGDGPFIAAAVLAGTDAGDFLGVHGLALHGMESIGLAAIITGLGKGVAGRALPGVKTTHEFEFGRGFHDRNGPFVSFPSGHTAAAFAMATTVSAEVGRADSSRARLVSILAYGGATAVGAARVVQRAHWPTDLPLAAAIGVWSGKTVQRRSAAGRTDALLRGIAVGPAVHGGMEVGWSSLAASGDQR